jgi:hypothetical protein
VLGHLQLILVASALVVVVVAVSTATMAVMTASATVVTVHIDGARMAAPMAAPRAPSSCTLQAQPPQPPRQAFWV